MHYSEPTNLVIVDRFTKFTPDLIDYFLYRPFFVKKRHQKTFVVAFCKKLRKNFCTI